MIKKSNEEIVNEILKRSYFSNMTCFVDEDVVLKAKETINKLIDGGCEIFDFPMPAGLVWHFELIDGGDLHLKSRAAVCQERQINQSLFEDLKSLRLAIFAVSHDFLRFVPLKEREFTDSSFKKDPSSQQADFREALTRLNGKVEI